MQAIILAGGRGTRLRPHTEEIPKPLLMVGDKTILGHQIETLSKEGVSPIVIVTGFLAEKIENFVKENFPKENFIFVHNEEYESSKPAFAIIKSLENLKDSTIYLNGDVFYEPQILKEVIENKNESATAIQETNWDEEEVNVIVDENGFVTELSKNLTKEESFGEFIGVTKIGVNFIKSIKDVAEKEGVEVFRHSFAIDLLNHVIHKSENKIAAVNVTKLKAIEIDTPEDLNNAKGKFSI
ncbi:MAG: phosphocholine cytidylyltransferase family protein [Candidatus Paceibacterota bacterium]